MRSAVGFATKILFYAMIGVLLALNASYTMSFVGTLFPNDWVKQWGSLIIFDAGSIIWFLTFLTKAEGSGQRGISLLMGVLDLVGSLVIAGAEVFGAAEQYLADPAISSWLRETGTWILFIWLGINIAATWIYHVTDPKQQEAMKARNIQDEVTAKALEIAGTKVDEMASDLADELSDRTVTSVLAQLNITSSRLLPARRQVIDVPSKDAPPKQEQPPAGTLSNDERELLRQLLEERRRYHQEAPAAGKAAEAGGSSSTEPEKIVPEASSNGKPPSPPDPTSRPA